MTALIDVEAAVSAGARYIIVAASTPHGVWGAEEGLRRLKAVYPGMKERQWDLDKPDKRVESFCRDHGIPFLALEPLFRIETALGWVRRRKRVRRFTRIGAAAAAVAGLASLALSPWLLVGFAVISAGLLLVHPVGRTLARRRMVKLSEYRPVELPVVEADGFRIDQTS